MHILEPELLRGQRAVRQLRFLDHRLSDRHRAVTGLEHRTEHPRTVGQHRDHRPVTNLRVALVDPDFDTVVYVLEYDEGPAFGTPSTVPEQTEIRWTPAEDFVNGQVYYWRVKAKDISNFRWTEWSPIWSVRIDITVPEGLISRQSATAQFDTNASDAGLSSAGDRMISTRSVYTAPS
jgi:hypothetical protein